jgi:predicted metalloendopeptidase
LAVEGGANGEKTNVVFLLQGGLTLPGRDQYIGQDSVMRTLRQAYQQYIGHMLRQAGFTQPERRAAAVLALETALAETQATSEASANDKNADHHWTREDFDRRAPGMDWTAFFEAARLAGQNDFVAWQPGAVSGLAALVGSEPLAAWKDYLRFRLLHTNADLLPRPFAELAAGFAGVAGQAGTGSREERALAATVSAMSDAIGRLYVERYFSAAQKARVQTIAANVIAALSARVRALPWMSPSTRAVAVTKLSNLYFGLGYPESWQDYSDLTVDPQDPIGNVRRVAAHNYRQALARVGQPGNRTQWWITPQTVGAVLLFQQTAYTFPAALLQYPKYDSTASDAANYGAIGAIVGHEASHFIDRLGMEYDTTGALHRWWTEEDIAGFQALADRIVDQYSSYRPFPDLSLDGKKTQGENVADLAGLAAAFDAYRSTLGTRAADSAYMHQQDRDFFLGFARSWRSTTSERGLRAQVASDTHAPDPYRIATVRNLDAWYAAFDVKPGQKLYLAPGERLRIW